MCAGTVLAGEPYALAGSRLVFTDWTYVRPASFGWYDSEGNNVSVRGSLEPGQAAMRRTLPTWGIRLAARPAARVGRISAASRSRRSYRPGFQPQRPQLALRAGRPRAGHGGFRPVGWRVRVRLAQPG